MDSYPHSRTHKLMFEKKNVEDPIFGNHENCNRTAQICETCKGIFRKYTRWVLNNKFNMYAKHRQLANMLNMMTPNELKKNVEDFQYLSRKLNSSLMRQIKITFKEVLDDKKYCIFFNDEYSETRQNKNKVDRQKLLDLKNQKYYAQGRLIHSEADCYELPFQDRYSLCRYCISSSNVISKYRGLTKATNGGWQFKYPFMQVWLEILSKVPTQRMQAIVRGVMQDKDFLEEVKQHINVYTYDISPDVSNLFHAQGLFETLFGDLRIVHEHNINIAPELITTIGNGLVGFVVTMVAIYCASTLADKILILVTALTTSGLVNIVSNLEKICLFVTSMIGKIFGSKDEFQFEDQYNEDIEEVYRAQGNLEHIVGEIDFVKVLAGILGTSIGYVGFKGISDDTWKAISMRSHTINSIERLWQTLMSVSKFIIDVFATRQLGLDDSATQLRDSEVSLGDWADEIVELVAKGGLELARNDVVVWSQAKRLYERGLQFNAKLTRNRNYLENGVYTAFSYMMRVVGEIYKVGKHLEKNATLRNEPFVIYSFGEPGIGKSTLQMYMITDVMNKFDVAMGKNASFRVDKNLFLRCPGEAFWSGYRETVHRVVVFDDLFQFTTEEKMVSEAIELIRTKNMVSYPLNMADLEDKGRTHFNSELIYCTANKPVPEQQLKHGVVAEARAITRRFDVVFKQKVVKRFSTSNGMIDPYKVSLEFPIITETGVPRIDERTFNVVYEFDLTTPSGYVLKEGISYNQLVQHIVHMMVLKRENNTLLINTLNHLNEREDFSSAEDVSFEAQTKYEEFIHSAKNDGLELTTSVEVCNNMEVNDVDTTTLLKEVYGVERMRGIKDNLNKAVSAARSYLKEGFASFKQRWNSISWYPTTRQLLIAMGSVSALALGILGAMLYRLRKQHNGDGAHSRCENTRYYFRPEGGKRWKQISAMPSERGQIMIEMDPSLAEAQSVVGSADMRTMKQKVRTRRRFVGQASDAPTMQLIQNKIRNNTAVIRVSWAKNQDAYCRSTMRGFFLRERLFVVPSHIFMGAPMEDENISIEIRTSGGKYKVTLMLKECEIYDDFLENRDLTFLRLPPRVPSFPDITSFLHETQNLGKFVLERGVLYVCDDEDKGGNFYFSNDMKKIGQFRYCLSPKESNVEIIQEIVGGFMYSAATTVGDCGAPLIWLNESNGKNKILGLHVAGRSGSGVATILSKDMLQEVERFFDMTPSKMIECETEAFVANRDYMEKAFLIGKVKPDKGIIYKGKSEIVPSILHGIYDVVETAPAILKYTKDVDPFRASIEKQFVPNIELDNKMLVEIVSDISIQVNSLPSRYKIDPYILDLGQCLNGVEGDEHILPMDMNTSPGYPYVVERRELKLNPNGKHAFIERNERGLWVPDERLMKRILEREHDAIKGVVTPTLFIDQLKDERREIEKVLAAKTRVFNVAPFDLNILVRKYFGTFIAHLMSNSVRGECAVGINPHGVDWKLLYDRLSCNGEYWLGGDYSNFDKTLSYQACMAVLQVIDDFYGDGHTVVRRTLFQTMFSAYHLLGDTVYWVPFGNPSGIALTVIINSLVNMVYIRYAWCMIMGSIQGFVRNVALSVYGDDNIMTVSGECIERFNMESISKILSDVGITYTTPTKKEIISKDIPLEELSYLKRRFRFERGHVFAPLDIRSIKEMLMWTRVSGSIEAATAINCEAALRELYHYGRVFYEIFVKDLAKRACLKNFAIPFMSYEDAGMYWGDNKDQLKFYAHRDFDVIRHTIIKDRECCVDSYQISEIEEVFLRSSKKANASLNIGFDHNWGTCIGVSSLYYTMMNNKDELNNNTNSELTEGTANTIAKVNDIVGTNQVNNLSTLTSTTNQIMVTEDTGLVTHGNFTNVIPKPMTVDTFDKPTLVDILERSYPIHGVWNASDAAGVCLLRVDLPAYQLSFPAIWAKVKNFQYFRADVDVSIRINGTKFHYGNLMLSWIPMGSNLGYQYGTSLNNVITASSNPCVLVSPSENEAHHMVIPYSLPGPYIPMSFYQNPQYHTGTLRAHVVNPLRAGASIGTSVNYTIFISFKNVDVSGFDTNIGDPQPQANFISTTDTGLPYVAPVTGYFHDRNYMAQGRVEVVKKAKTVRAKQSEEANEKKEKGIITSISETVSGVAGALIPIPEIGEIAMGVKTVADVVAGVAGFFGWSYPNSRSVTTEMSVHQLQLANTHGLNDTHVLSITPENAIGDAKRWFGITKDEMMMIDILQTPSMIFFDANWPAALPPNALITGWNVSPLVQYGFSGSGAVGTIYFPTTLSWAAQPFQFWRGSIRYHISIVASKMHVGRLRLVWKPTRGPAEDSNLPATFSEDDLSNLMSRIIDIESETEIDIVVPFLNNVPWLPTLSKGYASGYFTIPNGQIGLYVVNALDYPETVVPPVGINVWVSAGADFQVAKPSCRVTGEGPLVTYDGSRVSTTWYAQGLTREMIREAPYQTILPAHGNYDVNMCMGENVEHLKDVLMRPTPIYITIADNPIPGATVCNMYRFNPFSGAIWTNVAADISFKDYYSYLFRYSRGSINYKFLPLMAPVAGNVPYFTASNDTNPIISSSGVLTDVSTYNRQYLLLSAAQSILANFTKDYMVGGMATTNSLVTPLSITAPYFCGQWALPNFSAKNPGTIITPPCYQSDIPAVVVQSTTPISAFISVGDDFQFIFRIGPPAMQKI